MQFECVATCKQNAKCKDHYVQIKVNGGTISGFIVRKDPTQTMLQVLRISSEKKTQLDLMFTLVCYVDGASLYDSSTMQQVLQHLNPAYKLPSCKTVAGPLLDIVGIFSQCYTED